MKYVLIWMVAISLAYGPCAAFENGPTLRKNLVDAVRSGDRKGVQTLLSKGVRASTRPSERDETALEIALEYGEMEIARMLLNAGDPPESLFPGNYRSLSEAVRRGDRYLLRHVLFQENLFQSNWDNDRNGWRLLNIAVIKNDLPMLKALGECLPRGRIWGLPPSLSGAAMHPFELAIHLGRKKCFDLFLCSPFFPQKNAKNEYIYGDILFFTSNDRKWLLAAATHKRDEYVEAMLDVDPDLLYNASAYVPISNRYQLNIILKLKPKTLQRLWNGEIGKVQPLIGTGDFESPAWADQFLFVFSPKIRIDPNYPGIWKALAKLHEMGSRPRDPSTFAYYVGCLWSRSISEKEFEVLLRSMGTWPLEPTRSLTRGKDYDNIAPLLPHCWLALSDTEVLRTMIRVGVPIRKWRDKNGRNLLHYAAHWSGTDFGGFWIAEKIKSVAPNPTGGDRPLIAAASNYLVPMIIDGKLDINELDAYGLPPMAYLRPLEDLVRFAEAGATLRWSSCEEGHALNRWVTNVRNPVPNAWNLTPVMPQFDAQSLRLLRQPRVRALLNLPAGKHRRTPLTTACELRQQNPQQLATPFPPGCGVGRETPTPDFREDEKQRLEAKRMAVQEDEAKWQSSRDPLVALLLDAGADSNLADGRGWTPARASVESQDLVRLRTLIAHPRGIRCVNREVLLKALVRGSALSRDGLLALLSQHGVALK